MTHPGQPIPTTIWTIGHSTHPIEEFLRLLDAHRIEAIADVRRFPGSRKHPQFGREAFESTLTAHGIAYLWLPELGGRRQPSPQSPNTAWRNAAFRGYADHMASEEFAGGMAKLLALASSTRTAILCAEAVWWRCHRALISDELCARGIAVMHIADEQHTTPHPLTAPARIVDGRLSYAAAPEQQKLL
jgi:uncharacterized protein (DUF488 family)